ncbi:hypothetical protein [Cupriavidus pauculus]|uniref:hypothetical protein n=1 Tax=Cupriavidus pauculus TaxID=82633 RepID=UPI00168B6D41|nr:hypothetical protein [Cupriavidus pauculus]
MPFIRSTRPLAWLVLQPQQLAVPGLAALMRHQAHRAVHAPALDQTADLPGGEV